MPRQSQHYATMFEGLMFESTSLIYRWCIDTHGERKILKVITIKDVLMSSLRIYIYIIYSRQVKENRLWQNCQKACVFLAVKRLPFKNNIPHRFMNNENIFSLSAGLKALTKINIIRDSRVMQARLYLHNLNIRYPVN